MCVCLSGDLLGLRERARIYCLTAAFFSFLFLSPTFVSSFSPSVSGNLSDILEPYRPCCSFYENNCNGAKVFAD
jgi:hypothetical protein